MSLEKKKLPKRAQKIRAALRQAAGLSLPEGTYRFKVTGVEARLRSSVVFHTEVTDGEHTGEVHEAFLSLLVPFRLKQLLQVLDVPTCGGHSLIDPDRLKGKRFVGTIKKDAGFVRLECVSPLEQDEGDAK